MHEGQLTPLAEDSRLNPVITPLKVQEWEELLRAHPDKQFVSFITEGIKNGFRIGYDWACRSKAKSAKKNMKSADDHPMVVQDYLDKELEAGRVRGPLRPEEAAAVHISRFGVIPKPHQPGKWRLIVDLSYPEDASINDGIVKEECSLSYLKLDQVARTILKLEQGTRLGKLDVQSAYRVIPIHPEDRLLLGVKWKGSVYVDAALPFGLRSAPKLFTALADVVEWIAKQHGTRYIMHYLDDFIVIGAPDSPECKEAMELLISICKRLGLPLAPEKCEGPLCIIVYLGIEIDTTAMTMRLPQEKLARLLREIATWRNKKSCTRAQLQSLVGQLQHAATVVRPGRTFLRRLYDLLKVGTRGRSRPPPGGQYLRLNRDARSDLTWWDQFLTRWNGISMMTATSSRPPDATVTSDASGSWGCGAYWGRKWLQWQWEAAIADRSIAVKELLPIILAAAVWGSNWRGWCIECRSDNQAVVAVINSRSSHDDCMMHMLRVLFFVEARFDFVVKATHIPGIHNKLADDISRNRCSSLTQQMLQEEATPIPQPLLNLLVRQRADWTCQAWMQMFRDTFSKV